MIFKINNDCEDYQYSIIIFDLFKKDLNFNLIDLKEREKFIETCKNQLNSINQKNLTSENEKELIKLFNKLFELFKKEKIDFYCLFHKLIQFSQNSYMGSIKDLDSDDIEEEKDLTDYNQFSFDFLPKKYSDLLNNLSQIYTQIKNKQKVNLNDEKITRYKIINIFKKIREKCYENIIKLINETNETEKNGKNIYLDNMISIFLILILSDNLDCIIDELVVEIPIASIDKNNKLSDNINIINEWKEIIEYDVDKNIKNIYEEIFLFNQIKKYLEFFEKKTTSYNLYRQSVRDKN